MQGMLNSTKLGQNALFIQSRRLMRFFNSTFSQ